MSLKKLHHACACLPLGSFSDHRVVWVKEEWEGSRRCFSGRQLLILPIFHFLADRTSTTGTYLGLKSPSHGVASLFKV